jgi:hypothetical protein
VSGDLLTKGLELFATGDFAGAARAWVEARASKSDNPQIEAYISHLRQLAPEVVAQAEASLSASRGAPADAAAPGPAAAPAPEHPTLPMPEHQPEAPAPTAPPAPGPSVRESRTEPAGAPPDAGEAEPAPSLAAIELPAAAIVSSSARPSVPTTPPPGPASVPEAPALPAPTAIAPAPIEIPVPSPPAVAASDGEPPPAAVSDAEAGAEAAGPWAGEAALGPAIEVSSTSQGLDLVAAPAAVSAPAGRPRTAVVADEQELKELLELDDFTGALEVAERLLAVHPDHRSAKQAKARCRETLEQMYRSKIGDVTAVPRVLVSPEEVIWLDLDHRSGFLLAQVDGASTFEEIIELSGMERLESLRIVAALVQKGVIGVD